MAKRHAGDEAHVRVLPIFSVSNSADVTVPEEFEIFEGGRFYPSSSLRSERGEESEEFVFIQSDVRGILREPLTLSRGAAVTMVVIEIHRGEPLGFAHPMDYTCTPATTGFKYYLKKGLHCFKGGPFEASCKKKKAPRVMVEIDDITVPGYLCADFPLITDGEQHHESPQMSPTQLPPGT